ncbi:hypothetical protein [Actinoplanes italicus]|uniref:hypothetical protein n=1 Tax=Actinoplanes italicus TaxID=113567 RepID=UPI000D049531|nr:hypothetical protein [Actinoplanes italicus]
MVTRRIVAAVVGCLVAVAGACRSPRAGQAAVSWRAEGVASAIVIEPPSWAGPHGPVTGAIPGQ